MTDSGRWADYPSTAPDHVVRAPGHAARAQGFLGFRPRQGWAAAGLPRRAFAVACPLLFIAWMALGTIPEASLHGPDGLSMTADDPESTVPAWVLPWNLLYLFLGPPACYALARVLRPYPGRPSEATAARHWFAAAGAAYGGVMILIMATDEGGVVHFTPVGAIFMALALVILPTTAVWGICAAVRRAAIRGPAPGRTGSAV